MAMSKLATKIDNLTVYIDRTKKKVKIGYRGVAMRLGAMLGIMPKCERRKLRKALRREGFSDLSGEQTIPDVE